VMVVARAAAEIAGHRGPGLVRGRMRIRREERRRAHQLTGGAKPALRRVVLDERLLQRRELSIANQPLDGLHRLPVGPHGELAARVHRLAVEQHRARAAFAAIAADLRACRPQMIAQRFDQCPPIVHVEPPRRAVEGERDRRARHGIGRRSLRAKCRRGGRDSEHRAGAFEKLSAGDFTLPHHPSTWCGTAEALPYVRRTSGGALPVPGGIGMTLSRLNRVLHVDIPNQRLTVEPGVTTLEITRQVAPFGYYYAPDPSSQQVCSIGGNVAENSGGAHCLKYGFTTHHVLALEAVLPNGEMTHIGGSLVDTPGPDLVGLIVGSEGTLAIVTSVTVRVLRRPETVQTLLAAFDTIDAGGLAVSDIIGSGIIPAAVEMMDALAIRAA